MMIPVLMLFTCMYLYEGSQCTVYEKVTFQNFVIFCSLNFFPEENCYDNNIIPSVTLVNTGS